MTIDLRSQQAEASVTLSSVPSRNAVKSYVIVDGTGKELGYVYKTKYDTFYLDTNLSYVLGTSSLGDLDETKERLDHWLCRKENREKLYASLLKPMLVKEDWVELLQNNQPGGWETQGEPETIKKGFRQWLKSILNMT